MPAPLFRARDVAGGGSEHCSLCADFLISDEMIASKEETARGTLRHLADKYGGARGYARAIGLSDAEVRSSQPLVNCWAQLL